MTGNLYYVYITGCIFWWASFPCIIESPEAFWESAPRTGLRKLPSMCRPRVLTQDGLQIGGKRVRRVSFALKNRR